jgi:hypothetical protein
LKQFISDGDAFGVDLSCYRPERLWCDKSGAENIFFQNYPDSLHLLSILYDFETIFITAVYLIACMLMLHKLSGPD